MVLLSPGVSVQRGASSSHVFIPFLANATKPSALDFEGGECDIDSTGNRMECHFQQVLLTTSDLAPDTCLITTNGYDRTFERESAGRWISKEKPDGACGVVDVTTLLDEGGVRWTLDARKIVTNRDASPACKALDEPAEILSWQNLRRPLPCRFVQPGGITR